MEMQENEVSKVFDNRDFGYWSITVLRPQYDEKGKILCDKKGRPVAYKTLTDSEIVPFTYEGGIEAFMKNEVLSYAPDAYIDESKTQIGYEISFTKYFYEPVELRGIDEILTSLKSLELEASLKQAKFFQK